MNYEPPPCNVCKAAVHIYNDYDTIFMYWQLTARKVLRMILMWRRKRSRRNWESSGTFTNGLYYIWPSRVRPQPHYTSSSYREATEASSVTSILIFTYIISIHFIRAAYNFASTFETTRVVHVSYTVSVYRDLLNFDPNICNIHQFLL